MAASDQVDHEDDLRVFVSYSRRDYYAAEAVHSGLTAAAGVRPWMDVVDLRPGADWKQSIDDALDSADVLVLVGSRSALGSDHVRDEYLRAAARGIPIVLAIASDLGGRPDIDIASVHDLRPDLPVGVSAVCDAVRTAGDAPAAGANGTRYYRPPMPVLTVSGCLLVEALLVVIAVGLAVSSVVSPIEPQFRLTTWLTGELVFAFSGAAAIGPVALSSFAAVTTLVGMYAIARRRIKPLSFVVQRLLVFAVIAVVIVLVLTVQNRQFLSQIELPTLLTFGLAAWPSVLGAAVIVMVTASSVVLRSTALLSYTRTGYAVGPARRRLIGNGPTTTDELWEFVDEPEALADALGIRADAGSAVVGTFRIVHEKQDQRLADFVRQGCRAAGMSESPDADWTLLVVTGESDLGRVERIAERTSRRLICLLATPVLIPEDSDTVRRHQWLDFRHHDVGSLRALLDVMSDQERPEPLPVPIDPSGFRAPNAVRSLAIHQLQWSGFATAVAGGLLLSTDVTPAKLVAAGVAVVFTVLSIRITVAVTSRTATRKRYLNEVVASQIMLFAGVVIAVISFSPSWPIAVVYVVAAAVQALVALLLSYVLYEDWLLPEPSRRPHRNLRALADDLPDAAILSAVAFSLILALGVAPKPDLFWTSGYDFGSLHPNTALPAELDLYKDVRLSNLAWSEPSAERVTATGLLRVNNCDPSCAAGTYSSEPATVEAAEPAVCVIEFYPDLAGTARRTTIEIFTVVTVRDATGEPTTYDAGVTGRPLPLVSLDCGAHANVGG